jgi:hypothetical protein
LRQNELIRLSAGHLRLPVSLRRHGVTRVHASRSSARAAKTAFPGTLLAELRFHLSLKRLPRLGSQGDVNPVDRVLWENDVVIRFRIAAMASVAASLLADEPAFRIAELHPATGRTREQQKRARIYVIILSPNA